MHIVIAPNAFKGSLSATKAAECIRNGLQDSGLSCRLTCRPVADGGDGTVPLLVDGLGGTMIRATVDDPLGRPVKASYGWTEQSRTAFIALSDASGLKLLTPSERDPLRANTRGSGQLISVALDRGARRLVIGVGGSATVDGGTGLARALGIRFFQQNGTEITDLPRGLDVLASVRTGELDPRISQCEVTVLCDVKNILLGPAGAAEIFGPQKGADAATVAELERCLERLDRVYFTGTGIRMSELAGGGAAGGAAAGLAAFLGARLVSGIDFFLDAFHFDELLDDTDLVITGEGAIDGQTLEGKAPFGVACRAKAKGVPVVVMAGAVEHFPGEQQYFDRLIAVNPPGQTVTEAMGHTADSLYQAGLKLGRELAGGTLG
jgi:glycerate kinase